jgi:phosphoglycolate phosphatase
LSAVGLPRAVIFDWDNTLVDSWPAIAQAINQVRDRYGLPIWDIQDIMRNCTRSARDSFPEWFGDRWPDAWKDYYAFFEAARASAGLHPLAGASDLLSWLSGQGIPALVVSNKSDKYLQEEAELLGWKPFFASICGAHSAAKDKPAREHVDHALTLAGLTASPAIWFVGDSEADIQCARNAECTPVLIGSPGRAAELRVETVAADCRQLLELLSALHRAIA